jgi:trk system potassium uptake protein TrkH
MFLAGASFTLHYRFLRGQRKAHIKDHEFRFYVVIILLSTLVIIVNTLDAQFDGSIRIAFRYVLFQVVSIITTTGYGVGINEGSIYHFAVWSTFCQFLIIMLMFNGGSAGSTGGGIKTIRVYLMMKFVYNEILKFLYPRHIKLVRIGKDVIPDNILLSTLGFIMIHILVLVLATLIMNLLEDDLIVSFSAVVATLNNIGPGLTSIGPDGNFANISILGKWVLIFCMLLGRLELYSVIILLAPATWKKI